MAASSTLRTVLCGQAFEYQDDELDELDESDIVLTSESEEDISEHDDTDEDEDDADKSKQKTSANGSADAVKQRKRCGLVL